MSRSVHPLAWWGWALGVAIATSAAPGLAETALLAIALISVALLLRGDSPFARAFGMYLILAASIVALRVIFHILVGLKPSGPVLIPLPKVPLPDWAGGIQILGPVTTSGLLSAVTAGVTLATLLLCFGAAVALTDPRRTLRNLPASLYLVGTSSVIAVTLAPQLIDSWRRVQRAQVLRGTATGRRVTLRRSVAPVLQDALERSGAIAASMDSRGYARMRGGSAPLVTALLLLALTTAAIGTYLLLTGTELKWSGVILLAAATVLGVAGTVLAARAIWVTRYRPDRWRASDSLILVSGLGCAAIAVLFSMAAGSNRTDVGSLTALVGFCMSAIVAATPILIVRSK
ncbi:MAG: energy-coupling factor transporter transmembrane protein EcfT [Cryobacterium sp.]|nr:energy-coupling factor transporter transmembrane protein EcfT [Cryobacterium sp.]